MAPEQDDGQLRGFCCQKQTTRSGQVEAFRLACHRGDDAGNKMRSLAAGSGFQRIICRLQDILCRGAAHDQKSRRIDPEGMKSRRIKPAIFTCSTFFLDPDNRATRLYGAFCRTGGKGERKAGRSHMRAGVFGKNLMQRVACQTMRKGSIRSGKAERETARPPEARLPLICKTALRIVAFNGRNHAPQRRDVDAAHV